MPLLETIVTLFCEWVISLGPDDSKNLSRQPIGCLILEGCRRFLDNSSSTVHLEDISLTSKNILLVLYCVIWILSLGGNLCVLVIFALNKQVRHVTNAFLVSLALSDLMGTFFTIPFSILTIFRSSITNHIQPFTCKVVPYVQNVAATATVLTLCCICAERYVAIIWPLRSRAITACHRIVALLVGVWAISLLFSIPHAIWHTFISIPGFLLRNQQTATACLPDRTSSDGRMYYDWSRQFVPIELENLPAVASPYRDGSSVNVCMVTDDNRLAYVIFKWLYLVILFLLPTIFMSVAYVRIGCRLWHRSNRRGTISSYPNQFQNDKGHALRVDKGEGRERNVQHPANNTRARLARKVTLMVATAMVLFILCWVPHITFETVALTWGLPMTTLTLNLRYYLEWLSVSNCCHNPIIYTLLHEKFRRILATAITCKGNTVRPAITPPSQVSSQAVSHSPSIKTAVDKPPENDPPSNLTLNIGTSSACMSAKSKPMTKRVT